MAKKRTRSPRRAADTKVKTDREDASRVELATAIAIKNANLRGRALISLIPRLPAALATELLGAIRAIADYAIRSKAIVAIAPRLPEALIGEALLMAAKIPYATLEDGYLAPSFARADALAALAPRAPEELVGLAISAAIEIPDERARARALARLIPITPDEFVFPVFAAAMEFSENIRPFVVMPLVWRIVNPILRGNLEDKGSAATPSAEKERMASFVNVAKSLPALEENGTGLYYRRKKGATACFIDDLDTFRLLFYSPELVGKYLDLIEYYWKVEGDLLQSFDQKIQLWMSVLAAERVPEAEREALIAKFRIEVARATRPKWNDRRMRGGELATLTAPQFLKRVHAEDIASDGTVHNEIIRAIDPDLMQVVELYISKRRSRGQDLGDAEGLNFVLTRPSSRRVAKKPKARLRP